MKEPSEDSQLIPYSVHISGNIPAERASLFYENLTPLLKQLGALSSNQSVNIIFNPPEIGQLPVLEQSYEYEISPRQLDAEELHKCIVRLGETIRANRRVAGLSQANIAKSSGSSQAYISKLERAAHDNGSSTAQPKPEMVMALAHSLGLDEVYLLELSGYEVKNKQPE